MSVDSVIMDIDEDFQIPIILGRPFLATARAIIDVKRGKLTFEVGEEKIEFILEKLFIDGFLLSSRFDHRLCSKERIKVSPDQ